MVKNLLASVGDVRDAGSILGSGRSPGGGNGNPLQYSCLENSMDRRAWQAIVHESTKSQDTTEQLSMLTVITSEVNFFISSILKFLITPKHHT